MREQAAEVAELGASLVAVGFSPPAALAELAERLGWPSAFLADQERVLYRRLGLGRAPRREVLTPGTLRIYRDARRRGEAIHVPVEDYRQLGGDAIVARGRALRVFRPRSPDDRPTTEALLAALCQVGAGAG